MKKLIMFLLFIITLTSCQEVIDEFKKSAPKYNNPIKVKESRRIGMYTELQVIEIDGHEYISVHSTTGRGENSLIHSESCPCKNK